MARRMFSSEITQTDAFLDMPAESQLLYFHLGMEADDDGFIPSPKMVMRVLGSSEDALKLLFLKKFLLSFESGICVIKHWRMNNYIRKDIYKETKYKKEKSMLFLKKSSGAYSFNSDDALALPSGHFTLEDTLNIKDKKTSTSRARNVPLGKVSIDKDSKEQTISTEDRAGVKTLKHNVLGEEIIKSFEAVDPKNKTYYGNTTQRKACDFLLEEYGLDEVLKRISVLTKTNKIQYFPSITTPVQLRDKWVQLQDAADKKKAEITTKGRGIEI